MVTTAFSIVQGSCYKDLRQQSAEYIANSNQEMLYGFFGEPAEEMCYDRSFCEILPEDKPRYLMGVNPINILENIALGVDVRLCNANT
jgi:queuine tRNA-ribosyltransferase